MVHGDEDSEAPLVRAHAALRRSFGAEASILVRAPGRVNLIGEHTDYNEGFVLPCAIDLHTAVAGRPRHDGLVRVVAADFDAATSRFDLRSAIGRDAQHPWADYVRGVAVELLALGMPAMGADLAIAGNLPRGGGLSSSASLELAVALALQGLQGGVGPGPAELARAAQRAENGFVGCNCGIMDQLISACGRRDHALLIDCRSLEMEPVRLADGVSVLVVDSNIPRSLAASEYNVRRRQCETASRHFGVRSLRGVSIAALRAGAAGLDDTAFRRARHVVTENSRVLAMKDALLRQDMRGAGMLMNESHTSMRDDFEITVPAIDRLVAILQAVAGVRGGARMTGGGFGGCVVALLPGDQVADARAAVAADYRSPDGCPGDVYEFRPAGPAGIVFCAEP